MMDNLPEIVVDYGGVHPLDVAEVIMQVRLARISARHGTFQEHLEAYLRDRGEDGLRLLTAVNNVLDAVTASMPGPYKSFAQAEAVDVYTINVPGALDRACLQAIRDSRAVEAAAHG